MNRTEIFTITAIITVLIAIVLGCFWVVPVYNVWQKGKAGQAALMRAEQEKKIMVEQARAEVEAAELRAQAIRLVGEAAKEFPEYRFQEYLGAMGEAMQSGKVGTIIYVPTEAGIPILEASRRSANPAQ